MTDDTILPFWFPAVRGKKLTAGFDGGRLSSDGGVMLLAQAARRMRIAEKLAAVIPDPRDPTRVVHPLPEILLARILAIACGYEDADDLDSLRTDPAFKLACGRLPESGADLMSQPTVSRCENGPGLRDLVSQWLTPAAASIQAAAFFFGAFFAPFRDCPLLVRRRDAWVRS